MAFFKFLFYLILYFLIKIGDGVYSILAGFGVFLLLLLRPFALIFKKLKIFFDNFKKAKKKNDQTFQKYTIRLNSRSFLNFFKKTKEAFANFAVNVVTFLKQIFFKAGFFLWKIILFFAKIISFPFSFFNRNRKEKRLEPVYQNKTTFLYKVKYLFWGFVLALIFFFIPATLFIFSSDLPTLTGLSVKNIPKTTKILDRNGNLLFEIYAGENRTIVPLSKIPMSLRDATIAIEDKDFYRHGGFDLRGIARALYVDLSTGQLQGGSTITQQLVKSALLTPEPTLIRKTREVVLAFLAERKYTKNQILELYFNYVPYGGTAWGIQSASNIYFGKDVSNLSLAESAYLAGLPQAPSVYSPFEGDGKVGKKRQKEVLQAMVSQHYITQSQANKAYSEKLDFLSPQIPIEAPHFVMYVKDMLIRKYGLSTVERGGLQVTTTLDMNIQKMAQDTVSGEVDKDAYLGVGNGAALVTDPKNGDILAMVGSRDYFDTDHDGNVNLTTSLRQPGSTIKLITYTLALTKGYTEATILQDSPLTIYTPGQEPYSPVNYDGAYHGNVPLRIAFGNSFNIPAVRMAQKLGVDSIVSFGQKMGISSWKTSNDYGLSITLGAADVTMLDLSTAYGTIANGGVKVNLDPILEIKDSEGNILERKEVKGQKVVDPGIAFIISNILSDNNARSIEFGTNSPLVIPNQTVSVKTGTTDEKRDNWTIGFTPNYVVATWVGNNDNTPLSQALASGITGAAPIWHQIMSSLVSYDPQEPVSPPSDVVSKQCFGYTAFFIKGTEDKATCRILTPTPTPQKQ
jgi:1A family penicillin-binding protein